MTASVEHFSQHPLARAIVRAAEDRGLRVEPAVDFQSITGGGAQAKVGARTWLVGSPTLFRSRNIDLQRLDSRIEALQQEGNTVVAAAADASVVGLIAIRDRIRSEAAQTITELHRKGLRTIMLTGDNARTANAVARVVGIDEVRAELKPDDKVAAVQELAAQNPVLMVGDGVNDAPALAAATCGMAMGAAGTDAAIEAADIALMKDDLRKILTALRYGQAARTVSRQNIALSIAVLAVMIPLAVLGVINVATAVIVHEVAELLAVANGLRAGRVDANEREEQSSATP
jgi:Cd2+/Zn2+-exporting ATPase